MEYIYNLEDVYIKQYLSDIFTNHDITNDDFTETLTTFFDIETINNIIKERQAFINTITFEPTQALPLPLPVTVIAPNRQQEKPIYNNKEKQYIIQKYGETPVSTKPCNPYLRIKPKEKIIRYRDSMIVREKE